MSDTDDRRSDDHDPDSPWRADSFDRWLAALDLADLDTEDELDDPDDAAVAAGGGTAGPVADGGGRTGRGADTGSDEDLPMGGGVPDPWADLDLEPVDLSSDQREYLAWHEHQPPVPRLRGAHDEPGDDR
jgi:hypothetical protein